MKTVRFTIPGSPTGKGRPRSTRTGHHYTPKQTRDYELAVKAYFAGAYPGRPPWPAGVPLRLTVVACVALPKSATKAAREECAWRGIWATVKPDGDNILKIVCDALNGVAWKDDAQVAEMVCRKWRTTGEQRVEVTIEELT